jgi:hypothetical protein
MSPRSVAALLLAALLGAAVPAEGEDLLDYVITAIDPTLAPARPLIECLAGGGDAKACAIEAAKRQAAGALPVGPADDRVVKAVAVFEAAREERWIDVVSEGGEVVAKFVACAVIPVQGPVKGPVCNIIGWVISNRLEQFDKAYRALTGPDWWTLVEVAGGGVCDFIPGDGPAGVAKDVLCGPLASVLLEAQKFATSVSQGIVSGADALESAIFGDDSHMPYSTYYALYWQPWYHYSTARVLEGESLGMADIESACVDYFDSHNQYRSTARKTCGDLRNKFNRHVQAFAKAMPVAVDGYFESVARPAVRGFALASYGKPTAPDLPGRQLFEQNCAFQMRKRFPFPDPDEARCRLYEQRSATLKKKARDPFAGMFAQIYAELAAKCLDDVRKQDVQPTVWSSMCEEAGRSFAQAFAGESLKLVATLGRLKQKGCAARDPDTANAKGLLLICESPAAYSACMTEFLHDGEKYCRVEVPVLSASAQGQAQVSTDSPVVGAVAAAGGTQTPGEARPHAGSTSPPGNVRAAGAAAAVLRASQVDVEAEALIAAGKIQIRGGHAVAQAMTGFGPGWGGGAQLFWGGGAVGATLDLLVDVPQAGAWSVEILFTRAPDYGQLQFEVDRHPVAARFDGYAPQVEGPVTVQLGTFALQPGARRVSLMIIGRQNNSTGWLAGVDRVRLRRIGNQ